MENPALLEIPTESHTPANRNSIWRRLGGGALTFAVLFHVVLLIIGAVWIFQRIYEPEKKIDFMPGGGSGGGGGERSAQTKVQQKKRAQMTPTASVKRVFAEGAASNFSIPDPGDNFGEMSTLTSLSSGGSGGLGGSGSGGGFGSGQGKGVGAGIGLGGGGNGKFSPFGLVDAAGSALEGTFYDLKQDKNRQPTNMTDDEMRPKVREIVGKGFREREFNEFYHAGRKLYQTKFAIPKMDAEGAPAAFECQNEVQPRRWIVVYRGTVKAPFSGKFRFVGACDDLLVIKFNGRLVFDYGYTLGCTGTHMFGRSADVDGRNENEELAKDIRKSGPMRVPISFYKYDSTPAYNDNIGGFAVGPDIQVREGTSYPVEILIGEIPGGYFGGALMIEQAGVKYEKSSTGAPILPLFRTDSSLPDPDKTGDLPPHAANGPVWKCVSGTAREGF